ncbi:MAG: hypothetical protein ACOY4R_21410 [Pseudomonadota bacterium]
MRNVKWLLASAVIAGTAACTTDGYYPNTSYGRGYYGNNGYAYNAPSSYYGTRSGYYNTGSSYYSRNTPRRGPNGDYDRDGIPNRYDRDANGDGTPDRWQR